MGYMRSWRRSASTQYETLHKKLCKPSIANAPRTISMNRFFFPRVWWCLTSLEISKLGVVYITIHMHYMVTFSESCTSPRYF